MLNETLFAAVLFTRWCHVIARHLLGAYSAFWLPELSHRFSLSMFSATCFISVLIYTVRKYICCHLKCSCAYIM